MKNIITFIRNPYYTRIYEFDYTILLKVLLLDFIFIFVTRPFLFIWENIFHLTNPEHNIINKKLILIFLMSPIIEEFVFRFYLRPTKRNINIYVLGLVFLTVFTFVVQNFQFFYTSLFLLCICFIIYFVYRNNRVGFYRWYIKHFKVIFYLSAIFFGIGHITNYNLTEYTFIILAPMVTPQIFGGILLGFIRMKYGFLYSLLVHLVFNTIVIIPAVIKTLL